MIHPDTEVRFVNDTVGHGVFATKFIPAGTILSVEDEFDIKITPADPRYHDPRYRQIIDKYAYMNEVGQLVVCWDHARFVNHCCEANMMSTGYAFEIALRDIQPGEEIRDEYGMFWFDVEMPLTCHHATCRGCLRPTDMATYGPQWDEKIRQLLPLVLKVNQPLWAFVEAETAQDLQTYLATGEKYRSVLELRPEERFTEANPPKL